MKCPWCGSGSVKIIDSRMTTDDSRRRRYQCYDCKQRFTTYEYHQTRAEEFSEIAVRDDERLKTLEKIMKLAKGGMQ